MSRLTNNSPDLGNGSRLTPEERFSRYKKELHHQLITGMDLTALAKMSDDELRQEVRQAAEQLCRLNPDLLSLNDRDRLVTEVLDETFGLGPLEPWGIDGIVTATVTARISGGLLMD